MDYLYDAQGRLVGFRDQLDNLTSYFYEVPGRPS